MTTHQIASRSDWLAARKQLLDDEMFRDQLAIETHRARITQSAESTAEERGRVSFVASPPATQPLI
jgi:predicted dithiol-disulfide oxidoreductase (DUF899 family)